jgi:short-subunit dehydrogenase
MKSPSESVVLLTGAAGGIGAATAAALAAKGYRVGLVDRAPGALGEVQERLRSSGAQVAAEPADVCDRGQMRAAFEHIEAALGPTDIVVACAGVGTISTVYNLDLDGFRAMLEVNVLGVAHTIEAALPGMIARGQGHIVGISSVAGFRGLPWMPGYSASKAALTAYLEGLRPALKRRGITITTVFPGFVRTAMTANTPFRRPVPMLEPDQAAKHLVRAIERRPRDYVFPFSTSVGMNILRYMPSRFFDRMMDRSGPKALKIDF